MQKDRARHNILPLSKFGLMQITRQRVRPAMDVNTTETCPTCFGKGTIKSSILFTDTLESKIDYLVNKLKIKKFSLHIHPYIAAYVNQGLVSLKRKWQMKYGFGIKIIPNQKLAFLEYARGRDRHEGRNRNQIKKTAKGIYLRRLFYLSLWGNSPQTCLPL